jgi:hypothetical protein
MPFLVMGAAAQRREYAWASVVGHFARGVYMAEERGGQNSPPALPHRTGRAEDDMPINSKYLFIASMDVDADKEALFNEVYDTEHVPNLLKVPGVHAVTRTRGEPFAVSIGGEEKQMAHEGPRYSAIYEIDGPHVLVSPEWARAVELGRWPSQVRPYTRNRRHTLYQVC